MASDARIAGRCLRCASGRGSPSGAPTGFPTHGRVTRCPRFKGGKCVRVTRLAARISFGDGPGFLSDPVVSRGAMDRCLMQDSPSRDEEPARRRSEVRRSDPRGGSPTNAIRTRMSPTNISNIIVHKYGLDVNSNIVSRKLRISNSTQ